MSIDSCYENVIGNLKNQNKIKDISRQMISKTTNDERVLFVYDIIKSLSAFPNIVHIQKSEQMSTYYRNLGNKYYQKSEIYQAWQYYNLSLMHSSTDSENYILAISNRSAVFLSLNKYKECLEDIKEVFSKQYPEKLKDKLLQREKHCKKAISSERKEKTEDISKVLAVEGQRDSRYPCASTKVKVVYNKDMGRHIIATEDINVGEVLAQENPYMMLLLKSQLLFTCSYCFARNLNLLPCQHCCFTLYCSAICMETAWKEYHSVECPLMATLIQMEFTKLELLALRTVVKARSDHKNWADLFKTIEEAESTINTDLWGHVKVDDKWVYDSKYYASIHTLTSNVDKRTVSDIFQKSVTAAVFLRLLMEGTQFLNSDNEDTDKIRKCVAGLLLHHVMTSPTNMHSISSNTANPDGSYIEEICIGSAPYAFHSLINHSCTPNVVRFSKLGSGQMTLIALRPIKKGDQLFDNYGSHHAIQDRTTRQQALKFQYKFNCVCDACVNDWPLYLHLRPAGDLPRNILYKKHSLLDTNAIEKLKKGDMKKALKLFKPLCEIAQILDRYAPCIELADCQESMKQCLAIFEGLVPFEYNREIDWNEILRKTL